MITNDAKVAVGSSYDADAFTVFIFLVMRIDISLDLLAPLVVLDILIGKEGS